MRAKNLLSLALLALVAGVFQIQTPLIESANALSATSGPVIRLDRRQGRIRKILGKITVSGGTPAIAYGTGFTIADTAAGQVTVTLSNPGKSILSVVASAVEGTDATGHQVKADTITTGTSVLFGIYKLGGAAASISASNVTAPTATTITLSTAGGNTYTDAAVKTAVDDALAALIAKIKTADDAGADALAAKVVTALDLQDGILADDVGFTFEITVQD